MPKKERLSLRRQIELRAQGRCEYCRAPQSACGYRFHLEHIVPCVEGGSDGLTNRALACAACNLAKSLRTTGVDPETRRTVPLFNPRTDAWDAHLRWLDDHQTIIGVTPSGRATVVAWDLNAAIRLAARELWFDAGLLP